MTVPPTALDEQATVADLAGLPARGRLDFLRSETLRRPAMIVGLAILAFFTFLAVFGPWIEPYDPNTQTGAVYEPPSSAHWLGTDDAGADMLSLVIEPSSVKPQAQRTPSFGPLGLTLRKIASRNSATSLTP